MTSPAIRVVNPGAPLDHQQAVLLATEESGLYRDKKLLFPVPHPELLNQVTALKCAEKLLRAEGVSSPTRQQCLGKLVLPFGQYQNAPFHWLVENDVGYMKYLLDEHKVETSSPHKRGEAVNQWVKDFLTDYAESFPQVSSMLEANVDRCIYGQTGFEHHTFEEMWDLYRNFSIQKREPERFTQEQKEKIQRAHMSVTRWLNTPVTRSTTVQMKRFRKYICDKKQQEESSSSQRDPLSLLGDDAETVSASVEDSLTSEHPVTEATDTRKLLKAVAVPASTAAVGPSASAAVLDPLEHIAEAELLLFSRKWQQKSSTLNPDKDTLQQQQQDADIPSQHPTSSDVELEGWVKTWRDEGGIPLADQTWLREDQERGLYKPIHVYRDKNGSLKNHRVIRSNRMWFYPPEPPGFVEGAVPGPQLFFCSRVFVWRPVGVWRCSLECPRGDECVGKGRNVYLYNSGFHHQVRHICDVSSWYTMLTEVLCCGPCTKAAGEGGTVGQWPAWDPAVVSQLSEAHQAAFPAVLTSECGVDKNVVRLFRDRTEGNAMVRGWRRVQEHHMDEHLHRIDLYTTLLMMLVKPDGVASAFRHKFEPPPPPRELPSAELLHHVFLLAEAQNVLAHRAQMSSEEHATRQPVTKLTSISEADIPPAPSQPAVLPLPSYPVIDYKVTESTAGTKVLKKRTDLVMPVSQPAPQPQLQSQSRLQPGSQTPIKCETVVASSTSMVSKTPGHTVRPILPKGIPVQSSSVSSEATATSSPSPSWCRATLYKRKQMALSFMVEGKKSRVQNNPVCTICGQVTQGHRKYKRKTFCPVKRMSTSKGLTGIKFENFGEFMLAVDSKGDTAA